MTQKLLEINDLRTTFDTNSGTVNALRGVNLTINEGERVGLVGESGSGKSVTAQSILRLVDSPGQIVDGSIELNGQDLLSLSSSQMQSVRGRDITMIFQDPSTSLDPVYSIRSQMIETIGHNRNLSDSEAESVAIEYLEMVDMPNPKRVLDSYPHELSGGMKQRVSIAMALGFEPDLIIADEPTTALDVTVQKKVMDIFQNVVSEKDLSVLWITHNLGVVAEFCDKIAVIYAGEVVEYGSVYDIFDRPAHPYTRELLRTIPNIERADEELRVIEGTVPNMRNPPSGCAFHPRCPDAEPQCETTRPDSVEGQEHQASCLVHDAGDQ
ncbi:ABC transporter ATP-binding protein [Halobellus litoreus]|uniref:Nickel import system ATP-binding protein NikD n=1 Tax=Halobellus litoreus TaxID=755310 RepID=A0ABD6DXZ3_9EURY|nr:ABC transporter ATP-binding protein [Halobellus litoreus]